MSRFCPVPGVFIDTPDKTGQMTETEPDKTGAIRTKPDKNRTTTTKEEITMLTQSDPAFEATIAERSRCKAIADAGIRVGQPKVAVHLMMGNCSPTEAVAVFEAVNGTSRFHKMLRGEVSAPLDQKVWETNLKTALARIKKTI